MVPQHRYKHLTTTLHSLHRRTDSGGQGATVSCLIGCDVIFLLDTIARIPRLDILITHTTRVSARHNWRGETGRRGGYCGSGGRAHGCFRDTRRDADTDSIVWDQILTLGADGRVPTGEKKKKRDISITFGPDMAPGG